MFEKPYRPCPMCRTNLKESEKQAQNEEGSPKWVAYECPNCGSEVWIKPFARVIEGSENQ